MPTYEITAPDGKRFRVSGDGTAEEALAHLQSQYTPSAAQSAPQSELSPSAENSAPARTKLTEFRERYPQYNNLSDGDLARALHRKFYPQLDFKDFSGRIGYAEESAAAPQAEDRQPDYRAQYEGQSLGQANLSYSKDYFGGLGRAIAKQRTPDAAAAVPFFGAGETALHLGSSALAPLFALPDYAISKMGVPDKRNPEGTYAGAREKYIYQPRSAQGQAGAEIAGAALKPVGDVFSLIGSGYGDIARGLGASTKMQNAISEIMPDVVGAGLTAGALRPTRAPKTAELPPPTKADLAEQSRAAYQRAEDAGVVVSAPSFQSMKLRMLDKLEKEGIDVDLHPDASAALKRVASTEGPVTLEKLETLRRIAKDAEGSQKPSDARLAGEIVDQIDEYVDALQEADVLAGDATKAAALKVARGLYSRKKKTDEIDRLIARAELSPSGMDIGLRNEFRALAKNDRRMRRFTKEEQDAIRKVAKGGTTEFVLRQFGKLSSGPFGLGVGGGLGFAAGGPAGAVLIPAGAYAARAGANRLTTRNARAAQELMRRGPQRGLGMAPAVDPALLAQLQRTRGLGRVLATTEAAAQQ